MRCSVADDECVDGRLRAGMCEKHYRRQRATGSTASPLIDPFTHYTVSESGCWLWAGGMWPNGYGKTGRTIHGSRLAHRVFYTEIVGPIPDGLDLDHMCRVRPCCNPAHLEPVSRAMNLDRGHEARTRCENGLHDITQPGSTLPGTRQCVECLRTRRRAASIRYRNRTKDR